MSFILDALKKAESERHRAAGPVLVDVRIAPPRRRLPAWAWVMGCILLANLGALTWLMLRKPVAATTVVGAPAIVPSALPAADPVTIPPAPPPAFVLEPAPVEPLGPWRTEPAPLVELPAAPGAAASPVNTAGLSTVQELKSAGVSLPPLLLNLHVYDPTPAQRYVLLNGLRLAEGEFTPDGIKVEAITERGVVLEARGRRFLLPAGN
jgi:general secretion pathway protein B